MAGRIVLARSVGDLGKVGGASDAGRAVDSWPAPPVRRCRGGWAYFDASAAAGFAAVIAGCGGLRTITRSTMSGATWPPMIRSIELLFTESLLRIVWTWVAEVGRPSRST